jgi:hypothetical protein
MNNDRASLSWATRTKVRRRDEALTGTNGFARVSVHAHDLEESVRFYGDPFCMQEAPSPAGKAEERIQSRDL